MAGFPTKRGATPRSFLRTTRLLVAVVHLFLFALAGAPLGHEGTAVAAPTPDEFETLNEAVAEGVLDPEVSVDLREKGESDVLIILADEAELKPGALDAEPGVEILDAYDALPLLHARFESAEALVDALNRPDIAAVAENGTLKVLLNQSLPMVRQPQAAAWNERGQGTAVAVIDTGVDFTRAEFGTCIAPGTGLGCRVQFAADFAADDGAADDNGHGTNVAAIALGVAPAADILSLDSCDANGFCWDSDILAAIDWVVENQASYNIRALNISLGKDQHHTSACMGGFLSRFGPYEVAFRRARDAGVMPVVAAGNAAVVGGTFVNGVAYPACTPGAVRVGAVYDANGGAITYDDNGDGIFNGTDCTDSARTAGTPTCFSQTGPLLSVLAPGALITAGGSIQAGTSQAAPHVAGAAAVLAAAAPGAGLGQLESALVGSGPLVTDARNGVARRLLDVSAALRTLEPAANDTFTSATALAPSGGALEQRSWSATKESGEPSHAGNAGGASVWYRWTAPASGPVVFSTADSKFDTLLAVYVGSGVGSLTGVGSNDDCCGTDPSTKLPITTSKLTFNALAGTTYSIAVDGKNGTSGAIELAWDSRPSNDDFGAARAISGLGTWNGFNVGAGKEAGEPDHCWNEGGASVWYRWTAPFSASVDVATDADFPRCVAVYTGTSVNGLTRVAGDDWAAPGDTRRATFTATASTTYYIVVDGLSPEEIGFGPAVGTFTLSVSRSPRIVFASDRHGNLEIYSMKPDGADVRRLTNNAAHDFLPAWSSDRAKIAFVSNRDGNYEIYTMNADGTGQSRVTTNPSVDTDPAWSPDGTTIAFSSNRSGDNEIYLTDPAGASQARLTNRPGDDLQPAWSPDGSKIAVAQYHDFNGQYGPGYDIRVINLEGNAVGWGGTTFGDDLHPSWSPSGSTLVFSSEYEVSEGLGSWLFRENDDGSAAAISSGPFDVAPAWGPQGKIAFEVVNDVDDSDIYLMAAGAGGSRVNLTQNPAWDGQPDWR